MYCFDIETAGKLLHNPWYSISEIVEPSALRRLKLLYVKVLQGYQNFLRTYAAGSLGYLYKNKQNLYPKRIVIKMTKTNVWAKNW